MLHALHQFMEKEVEVAAVETTYCGILRGVTETAVVLWSADGWLNIPHTHIKGVKPAPQAPSLAKKRGLTRTHGLQ